MKYQVGCFQHKKKVVVKFLWPYNIFYSGIFFFFLSCFSVFNDFLFCFVSSIFYSIKYLLTVGSLVT